MNEVACKLANIIKSRSTSIKKEESFNNNGLKLSGINMKKVVYFNSIILTLICVVIICLTLINFLRLEQDQQRLNQDKQKLEQDKKTMSLTLGEYWDNQLNDETRRIFKGFEAWGPTTDSEKDKKWLYLLCKGQDCGLDDLKNAQPEPEKLKDFVKNLGMNKISLVSDLEKIRTGLVRVLNTMESIAEAQIGRAHV